MLLEINGDNIYCDNSFDSERLDSQGMVHRHVKDLKRLISGIAMKCASIGD